MSEGEIYTKKIYELLWLVAEISSNPFLYQGLKCNPDCEKCSEYPCERFSKLARPNHPLRNSQERIYTIESPHSCSLDYLPSIVLDKIFKYCKKKDLMTLGRAFPQYKLRIISPEFWSEIFLNDLVLSDEEVLKLLKYLNKHVNKLVFNEWIKMRVTTFRKIIELVPCLNSIQLLKFNKVTFNGAVDLIVEKLPNLTSFKVPYLKVNDEQLIKLAKLQKIQKIHISSDSLSNDALYNFFRPLRNLKSVFIAETIKSNYETIQLICKNNTDNLEELSVTAINDDAFKYLPLCFNLRRIEIKDNNESKLTKKTLEYLCNLKMLVSIKINSKSIDNDAFYWFFKNAQLINLKQLQFISCEIDDRSLISIASKCLSLNSIYLSDIKSYTDVGLDVLVHKCSKLECIALEKNPNITGEIFLKVSQEFLPKLRFLVLYGCVKAIDAEPIFNNLFKCAREPRVWDKNGLLFKFSGQ